MIKPDPLLMGHESPKTEEPAITSGVKIPAGKSKTLLMVEEQDRRDTARRKKLLRQIQNAQCEESGLLAFDFDDGGESL
jgi:hypothetical protein